MCVRERIVVATYTELQKKVCSYTLITNIAYLNVDILFLVSTFKADSEKINAILKMISLPLSVFNIRTSNAKMKVAESFCVVC